MALPSHVGFPVEVDLDLDLPVVGGTDPIDYTVSSGTLLADDVVDLVIDLLLPLLLCRVERRRWLRQIQLAEDLPAPAQ